MKLRILVCHVMSAAALGACATAPETGEAEDALDTMSEASDRHDMPTRAMAAARPEQGKLSLGGSSGIYYFGGPLMVKGTNLHYIWYVSWAGNTAPTILTDFASSLGGSSYWNINTTYSNGANVHVPNQVAFADSATVDGYPYGTSLSDSQILQIVKDHLGTGTPDPNGIYFVLTSADVTASSGFCTKYCGWHKHASINGVDTKYSFVGNPDRCPSACAAQTTGPNGNAGADGMASVIAHEAEEATTDPDLNAWFDFRGNENADKCAWTFGTTYTASNGAKANMHLGSRDFLIQRNWVNAGGGYCALKY